MVTQPIENTGDSDRGNVSSISICNNSNSYSGKVERGPGTGTAAAEEVVPGAAVGQSVLLAGLTRHEEEQWKQIMPDPENSGK